MTDAIRWRLTAHQKDIGGLAVRRLLPAAKCRAVGPFIFFDHMGPAMFGPDEGVDVRPHPHIGLATVTYLFEGALLHRDSLGTVQEIRPGDVNWMTAGRGIVHSERTARQRRVEGEPLHGLQLWIGMMARDEEIDPGFAHLEGEQLPVVKGEGKTVRIIAGAMFGGISPLKTTSETLLADVILEAGAGMPLDTDYEERAIYVSSGEIDIEGDRFGDGRLLIFRPGDRITVRAVAPSRIAVVGGAPLDGKRYVWWNFVSSRKERIDQAKEEWKQGRFGKVPGDEIEFIPLPENRDYTAG